MSIPDYQSMMLPLLKLFASGKTSVIECLEELKLEFSMSDEEANELVPSGKKTYLADRAHWARTYLGKAGFLKSPKRGHHELTRSGKKFLETNPAELNNKILYTSHSKTRTL